MSDGPDRIEDEGGTAHVDASLESLVPRYMERRKADIAALESAVAEGDWSIVTTLGHSMKGSGGGYGFDRITELGAAIEQAGRNEDEASALECTARLASYISNVVIEFVEE